MFLYHVYIDLMYSIMRQVSMQNCCVLVRCAIHVMIQDFLSLIGTGLVMCA